MYVTPEVKARVITKLKEVIALAEKHYKITLRFPNVVYLKRGTTAGTANYGTWTIDLNAALLMQNIDKFIERTVPHEMAHLVCHITHPEAYKREYIGRGRFSKRSVHGAEWQEIMRVMGVRDSTRCHSYDTTTTKVVKSTSRSIEWRCGCGQSLMLSEKKSNALRANAHALWHRGCKGRGMTEVKAAAPAVQKPVYALAADAPSKRATEAPGSKLEKCANLYVSYQHLGRQMVIAMFVQEAGCTPSGASSYHSVLKKRYS